MHQDHLAADDGQARIKVEGKRTDAMTARREENLSHDSLRQLLHYDEATGVFTWRVRPGMRVRVGAQAGSISQKGYRNIAVLGRRYRAGRLAWFYVHGRWPAFLIDHKNGVRDDNRLDNLRDASAAANCENLRHPKTNNSTGYLGVRAQWNRYLAEIQVAKKTLYLGSFDTPQEAHQAYLEAKRLLHAGCTI